LTFTLNLQVSMVWKDYPKVVALALLCSIVSQSLAAGRVMLQESLPFNASRVKGPQAWQALPSRVNPPFDYAEAMHKALIYFRIMRSGKIVGPEYHIAWRSNSCTSCQASLCFLMWQNDMHVFAGLIRHCLDVYQSTDPPQGQASDQPKVAGSDVTSLSL
jgi:hypothetical protein